MVNTMYDEWMTEVEVYKTECPNCGCENYCDRYECEECGALLNEESDY